MNEQRGSKAGFILGLVGGIIGAVVSILSYISSVIGGYHFSFYTLLPIISFILFVFVIISSFWMRSYNTCRRGGRISFVLGIISIILPITLFLLWLYSYVWNKYYPILSHPSPAFLLHLFYPSILVIIAGIVGLKASR